LTALIFVILTCILQLSFYMDCITVVMTVDKLMHSCWMHWLCIGVLHMKHIFCSYCNFVLSTGKPLRRNILHIAVIKWLQMCSVMYINCMCCLYYVFTCKGWSEDNSGKQQFDKDCHFHSILCLHQPSQGWLVLLYSTMRWTSFMLICFTNKSISAALI